MHTTLFLVRHGDTEWQHNGRVLGRGDVSLSPAGIEQANGLAERFAGLGISEVISSPLHRAVETAERIAHRHAIEIARDPRLNEISAGAWEGQTHEHVRASDQYQAFVRDPRATSIPGGEGLGDVRDRAVSSIEQALEDNELGSNIVVVSHAGVLRIVLAHYLGMRLASYHRLRLNPASISVLRFGDDRAMPRLLAINFLPTIARLLD